MKKFHHDLGMFVCPHVFNCTRSVLLAIRDTDGDFQFLCGADEVDTSQPHLIGIGHLLNRDPTIEKLAVLELGQFGERDSINHSWVLGDIEES